MKEQYNTGRRHVCVQGLGFVGFAMAVAVADTRDETGSPMYTVTGVELDTAHGRRIIETIMNGNTPIRTDDQDLLSAFSRVRAQGNLSATTDVRAYEAADIAIMDINLDLDYKNSDAHVDFSRITEAARTLGLSLRPNALLIVETTVPPGTCAHVVRPALEAALAERNLPPDSILLAHSYERVTPGKGYYRSIKNFWRVYAADDDLSSAAAEDFLSTIINTDAYPLTRLRSMIASETAKVLENSYRAVNIAFIEEWGRFAEQAGVDLFEVIDAIRIRSTHSNIRQPGFGVGGYCLTKDPLFGVVSANQLLNIDVQFEFSSRAIAINREMPRHTVKLVEDACQDNVSGKSVLVIGASYLADVGDLRSSPTISFVRELVAKGALVDVYDPLVDDWDEPGTQFRTTHPTTDRYDCVVLAVRHSVYTTDCVNLYLGQARTIVDANRFLNREEIHYLQSQGASIRSIGRG